ncbi:MAG: response regulator transcription factor [Oscillospiraceae bacterium]|nr:response regulator transcription factor [Oscillospiraceae bacterium]
MIKFAVCDDEPEMAQALCAALTAYVQARRADGCCVRSFSDGRSLLECGDSFDVILLDIQMSHPDGMETARQLRRRGERSLLVFVTVLEACVFDAFEVDACGYLLKPLDPGRFERTMNRVVKRLEERSAQTIVVQRFFKCHRSYLVNLDHVRGCRAGQVFLPRGEAIPVSRLRERELVQALLRHMKERDV